MSLPRTTAQIENCLHRWAQGEEAARNELLTAASDWLRRLAAVMLGDYPRVRRWEQTDDVLQNALVRLWRALQDVRPQTPREFCGLAALQIRRELVDLARHYFGPLGLGAHHATETSPRADAPAAPGPTAGSSCNPARLAAWTEFHDQIAQLPEDLRAAFEARWYLNLPYAEAAELLGVSVSTVIRHYQAACRVLNDAFQGELPFA
jgi:RNA polymerase sigma-70 factor (ECF subfamily)